MRYVIDVNLDDGEVQSAELTGLPPLPMPGDTVQAADSPDAIVGIVKERHFTFQGPDLCRIALSCKRL